MPGGQNAGMGMLGVICVALLERFVCLGFATGHVDWSLFRVLNVTLMKLYALKPIQRRTNKCQSKDAKSHKQETMICK